MRRLNADEATLWQRVVAAVRPLNAAANVAPFDPAPINTPAKPFRVPAKHFSAPAKAGAQGHPLPSPTPGLQPSRDHKKLPSQSNTLDGGWDRRLIRGTVQPTMTVDLHGHTLATAHATLDAALDRAVRDEHRLLLLVTGKPRRDGSGRGAIRQAIGDWLASSRHASDIAAVRGAHPRHGGAGALYIVMRRRRG